MLPASMRKMEVEEAFKMSPAMDYLASKHTYSSMRKIADSKSRKLFIFDDYDIDQKRREALASLSRNKNSKSLPALAVIAKGTAPHEAKASSVAPIDHPYNLTHSVTATSLPR